MIRIAIAEDHQLVRQGMVSLLNDEDDIEVVFDVGNGSELLTSLENEAVDIILLDLNMPIITGQQALPIIGEKHPETKVLIVSSHNTVDFIMETINLGARGFIPKNYDIEKVIDAIHAINEQGYFFEDKISPDTLARIVESQKFQPLHSTEPLSDREIEIVRLICDGKSNKEISDLLFISQKTVENHRKNISNKTKSKNVAGVVIYALKNGLYEIKTN